VAAPKTTASHIQVNMASCASPGTGLSC